MAGGPCGAPLVVGARVGEAHHSARLGQPHLRTATGRALEARDRGVAEVVHVEVVVQAEDPRARCRAAEHRHVALKSRLVQHVECHDPASWERSAHDLVEGGGGVPGQGPARARSAPAHARPEPRRRGPRRACDARPGAGSERPATCATTGRRSQEQSAARRAPGAASVEHQQREEHKQDKLPDGRRVAPMTARVPGAGNREENRRRIDLACPSRPRGGLLFGRGDELLTHRSDRSRIVSVSPAGDDGVEAVLRRERLEHE